jgi:hypothetical protein
MSPPISNFDPSEVLLRPLLEQLFSLKMATEIQAEM